MKAMLHYLKYELCTEETFKKRNLVEYGFRLPAAMDNRPLKFEEFESLSQQTIYVSATPADYELQQSEGVYTEQIIRPNRLLIQ